MSRVGKRLHHDSQAFMQAMLSEFKLIFKDKAVFSSFIVVALLISFVYSYVYSEEVLTDLPVAVVDNDNTTHSRQLLRMVDGASQTKIYDYYTNLQDAKKAFEQDKVRGVLVIPHDFSKSLQRNDQPTVSVYADASYMLYFKQIVTAVKTCTAYMNAGIQVKKKLAEGNLPTQALDKVASVKAKVVSLYNSSSGYATFIIPIVLVIIFQTTMLTSIGIIGGTMREKRKLHKYYPHANELFGTAPIILGKATTYLVICITILIIMLGIVLPMFNIPMRSTFINVLVFMLPFFLSVVYLGVSLNALFKRREDSILFIMFTSIPAMMITGFSYPMEMMPDWIRIFSYFVPSTLGAKGFVSLTQMGADFHLVHSDWLAMWGVCIFYFIIALLASKRVHLIEAKKSN